MIRGVQDPRDSWGGKVMRQICRGHETAEGGELWHVTAAPGTATAYPPLLNVETRPVELWRQDHETRSLGLWRQDHETRSLEVCRRDQRITGDLGS
jgi:hypothetical protein